MQQYYTTKEKASLHDTTMPLLKAMYTEFKELAKKKPEAAVSKSKIKLINRLLEKINIILKDEKSIEFLDMLEEDDIPQISDVTLILSQYVAAMAAFQQSHYGWDGKDNNWFIK